MNTTQKIHMIKHLNTPPEDFLVFRTTFLLCIHFKIWKRKVCAVCVVFVKAKRARVHMAVGTLLCLTTLTPPRGQVGSRTYLKPLWCQCWIGGGSEQTRSWATLKTWRRLANMSKCFSWGVS